MLEAIIFDVDGTILQSTERVESWFKHWSKLNKKSWPFKSFEDFFTFYNMSISTPRGVQKVYEDLDLPCDMQDMKHPVWAAYKEYTQNFPVRTYPGIKEAIYDLWNLGHLSDNKQQTKRMRLGLNTSNSWSSIYKDLKREDVLGYFDCKVTAETLASYQGADKADLIKKPSPISLGLMLDLLESEGQYTMHIGDTKMDLQASHNIVRRNPMKPESLVTVGAAYGYEGRKSLEKGAEANGKQVHFDYIIDKPEEIVHIVKEYITP